MKRHDLIRHLEAHGCNLIREGGSHSWWGNAARNRRSSVPRHREVSDALVLKICKDLDIPSPRKAESA
ncbi:MAG: type II toxin-antitoxin system HicA family toxin [Candidatus Competibacteraceae bacterium]|nr:type II toxin-antitoxin system HicA family toxin [Candidatus Competibacteraceae bacterium]